MTTCEAVKTIVAGIAEVLALIGIAVMGVTLLSMPFYFASLSATERWIWVIFCGPNVVAAGVHWYLERLNR